MTINARTIGKYDNSGCFASINMLPMQLQQSFTEARHISLNTGYKKNISNVIFAGMGGSSYAGRIIRTLFADQLPVPVDLASGYDLPDYVNNNSLVVVSSYSGNTEETLSCLEQAIKRKSRIVGISAGGKLFELSRKYGIPFYRFDPKYNPSGQPRLGQGYMLGGQLAFMESMDLIKLPSDVIADTLHFSGINSKRLSDYDSKTNPVIRLANEIKDRVIILVAAEFLEGTLHSVRNPFHETAKQMSDYFAVPELNHHLMEGLSFPESNTENLVFVLFLSGLYPEKIRLRMKLTREIIEKNRIRVIQLELTAKSRFGQVVEMIQFSAYLSFYLAIMHGKDPALIPWVDYFKNKLSERSK